MTRPNTLVVFHEHYPLASSFETPCFVMLLTMTGEASTRCYSPATPAKKYLSPPAKPLLYFPQPRSSRASSIAMSDDGARCDVPTMDIAVEPREAQRPTSLAARTPQAATPGNRESPWVRSNGPSQGPYGASQAPGASRRSIPSFRGETENRDAGNGAPEQQQPRHGGALAIHRFSEPEIYEVYA